MAEVVQPRHSDVRPNTSESPNVEGVRRAVGSVWQRLFGSSEAEINDVAAATQPILTPEEYRRLATYQSHQRRLRRFNEDGLSRYVAVLSNICLMVEDVPGYYAVEFLLGPTMKEYCIKPMAFKSGSAHTAVTDTIDRSLHRTLTNFEFCATNEDIRYNTTWQADWRGNSADLKQEALTIRIWRREWSILRTFVGTIALSLQDFAAGDVEHTAFIPSSKGSIASGFRISFEMEFSELYTFDVAVESAEVDLSESAFGRGYESYRLLLSTNKGKGSFPLADGHWQPNKSSTVLDAWHISAGGLRSSDSLLESTLPLLSPPRSISVGGRIKKQNAFTIVFDQPGSLLWRGFIGTFANLVINLEVQGRHRAGEWESYAAVQIPAYPLLHAQSETFNNRPMRCKVGGDSPTLSCTMGIPHRPEYQQTHIAMQRGTAPSSMKIKINSISGQSLSLESNLEFACAIATSADESFDDLIQTFSPLERTLILALPGIPQDLFVRKRRPMLSTHKRSSTPRTGEREDLYDPNDDNIHESLRESLLKFEAWARKRFIIIHVWSSVGNTRRALGHGLLPMANVISAIMSQTQRTPKNSIALANLTCALNVYGMANRPSGIALSLTISLSTLPQCAVPTMTASPNLRKLPLSNLPLFSSIDHLGQPRTWCEALALSSMPALSPPINEPGFVIPKLTAYDIGRMIRIVASANKPYFLSPLLCLFEGMGSKKDIAILISAMRLFDGCDAWLAFGKNNEDRSWCVVEFHENTTWWYEPGAWHIEQVPNKTLKDNVTPTKVSPKIDNDEEEALFPGGLKLVELPSFIKSLKFIANTEFFISGFGPDIGNFRHEVDTLERLTAAQCKNLLAASHLEPNFYYAFAGIPSSVINWTGNELKQYERRLKASIHNNLIGVHKLSVITLLETALESLISASLTRQIGSVQSILREIENIPSTLFNGFELNMMILEAPTADQRQWTAIVDDKMRNIVASKFAVGLRIIPCSAADLISTKVIILLAQNQSSAADASLLSIRQRIENCPAFRPSGDYHSDMRRIKQRLNVLMESDPDDDDNPGADVVV